jgi:glutathione peroxidase
MDARIETPNDLTDIPFAKADGEPTSLQEFEGKVLLIVNVASRCGLTPQYDGLVALQSKFRERGFTVLGFPANDFGSQEPGTNEEIQSFCRLTYGVDFPVFGKISVKGEAIHPLYRTLIQAQPSAMGHGGGFRETLESHGLTGKPGEILWNFEKFLVNRKGEVVGRFAPDVAPEDPMILRNVESELLNH